ncbi:hypothetical protein [Senegalia massiliensis]|uniref:hypothetical protein n=1 Tax=Senegalia massiliensis TaxID=1720316 RepID=UPI00136351CA|nr:hypothetical protein [Senegalia massiliensis]
MNKEFRKVIFKAIGLGMGVATLVLNIMKSIGFKSAISLLSIGLICLAIDQLENK